MVLSVQLCAYITLTIIVTAEKALLWGLNNIMQVKLLILYLEYRCVTIESPCYIIGTNFFNCQIVITLDTEHYNQEGQ